MVFGPSVAGGWEGEEHPEPSWLAASSGASVETRSQKANPVILFLQPKLGVLLSFGGQNDLKSQVNPKSGGFAS